MCLRMSNECGWRRVDEGRGRRGRRGRGRLGIFFGFVFSKKIKREGGWDEDKVRMERERMGGREGRDRKGKRERERKR